ncbi:MAG TPA: DNA polymerase, partial [Chitinophagales bacterium]|nr:DNA polymerase [Chitinophagales bacterium]
METKFTMSRFSKIYRKYKDALKVTWNKLISKKYRNELVKFLLNEKDNREFDRKQKQINELLIDVITKDEPRTIKIRKENQFKYLLNQIKENYLNDKLIIKFPNGEIRFLNIISIDKLLEKIESKEYEDEYSQLVYEQSKGTVKYTIEKWKSSTINRQSKKDGSFFPYLHNTEHNFDRFQLFKKFKIENYRNNCLYDSLKNFNDISEAQLNVIKSKVKNRKVCKSDLGKIAKQMGITIKLYEYKNKSKNGLTYNNTFYNKGMNEYSIALFEGHYFTFEKFIGMNIDGKKIRNSLSLFNFLKKYKTKYLSKITSEQLNQIGYNTEYYDNLDYNKEEIVKENVQYHNKIEKKSDFGNIYFADFECFMDDNNIHKPYQIGFESYNKDDYICLNYSEGHDLSTSMLDIICKKNTNEKEIIIYFHNAKYDSCFFFTNSNLYRINPLVKNGTFYKLNFTYYHKNKPYKFEIRDTYKHLNYPLSEFPTLFKNINKEYHQKEIMPYNFYKLDKIKKRICDIKDAVQSLKKYGYQIKDDDINHFVKNIDKWKLRRGENTFDIIGYSREYNKLDVKILKYGFLEWRKQILEFTQLDIFDILTTASLSQKYFEKEGAYANINKLNQIPRKFIHSTVYGGRCASRYNRKYKIDGKIQDFDGVSLYPSAIHRMKELGGILQGLPKILNKEQLNMEFLNKCDGYFVQIKIKKIDIKPFSQIPFKQNKKMIYDNKKLIGEIVQIGKIQLEDLIKFENCEFELIKGYYFDEGRCDVLCNKILYLFEKRLELKKQSNPLEAVIKLLLNSAYGKTIQKENETKLIVLQNKEIKHKNKRINLYKKHIDYNYNNIKSSNKMGESDNMLIENYIDINEHFGMPHIGSEILAMSKRIMSEVMDLAECNGIKIYYQDTDSMHLKEDDVLKLETLFKQKYGRELIGKKMGQFHCDFTSKKIKGNLYSKKCIILGKKSYMDILTNENGEIDYHIRMKGIPQASIDHYMKKNNMNPEQLFEKLYAGNKIVFDLTCEQTKPKFNI